MDQVFNFCMIIERKIITKGSKLHNVGITFKSAKKTFAKIDLKAMQNVVRVYGIGGKLLCGFVAFSKPANVCVKVN